MSLERIISQFGYPALIAGLLLEGETVLVLAAFMAHRGYLSLPLVIFIGFVTTFASDQFFFWLGRTRGNQFLEKKPAWKPNVERARLLLGRNTTPLFIGFRFMYGLRTVMPFVFGISRFDPKRFAFLNLLGAFLWALIFGVAGYLFGQVLEVILIDVDRYEPWIVFVILFLSASVWLYRRHTIKATDNRKNHEYVSAGTDWPADKVIRKDE